MFFCSKARLNLALLFRFISFETALCFCAMNLYSSFVFFVFLKYSGVLTEDAVLVPLTQNRDISPPRPMNSFTPSPVSHENSLFNESETVFIKKSSLPKQSGLVGEHNF